MFPLRASTTPIQAPDAKDATPLLARAPRLKDAVEPVIRSLVKSLQKMAGATTNVQGTTGRMALRPAGDTVAAHLPTSVAALVNCPNVPCVMLAALDATLVHAIIDLLCGGNGSERLPDLPRLATPIDQQFAHIVFTLVAGAIESEWAAFGIDKATASKLESAPTLDMFGGRVDELASVEIELKIFGQNGILRLAMPPAAFERFRSEAAPDADAPAGVNDPWGALLQTEIYRAPVTLDAFMEAKGVRLGSLADLKIGQIIALPKDARARATLTSEGRVLFRGEVGQADGLYSLRIEETVTEAVSTLPKAQSAAARFDRYRV